MERAIKRQAVAEWRDLQILSAAALMNLAATHARAAFERELVDDALREALFHQTEWATGRIDAIMQAALKPEIKTFWATAADDLTAIDQDLAQISEALKRGDTLAMPVGDIAEDHDHQAGLLAADAGISAENPSQRGLGWLSGIGGRVTSGTTGLATSATKVFNRASPERLKLTTRLRSAAGQRIDQAWMGQGAEPEAVLAQVIALIDEAAYSARTGLS